MSVVERQRHSPGAVRDAIVVALSLAHAPLSLKEIEREVWKRVGAAPPSSVRSYLNANTPGLFSRPQRGFYQLASFGEADPARADWPSRRIGRATLIQADCIAWLETQDENTYSAVVTDPPYGLAEYSDRELEKKASGAGGLWRIPPSFDGVRRSPLPRFTVLGDAELVQLEAFLTRFARALWRPLVPGANVLIASNPLMAHIVVNALCRAGFERRGMIIRTVMTMRGGDRPKNAHSEFADVSVMPRSMWEPWVIFRKPLDGRVQDNLRRWGTGGFRRLSDAQPFGDVIASGPTPARERRLAPHPSLKPQDFMRKIVRASLPLGEGLLLDPFAGGGSTLAAANRLGFGSVGVEREPSFFKTAVDAIEPLSALG